MTKRLIEMDKLLVADNRVKSSHASLYRTLLVCWLENEGINPFRIDRNTLMRAAKIGSKATYHACMRDLQNYGYILYSPTFNSFVGSKVQLLDGGECDARKRTPQELAYVLSIPGRNWNIL